MKLSSVNLLGVPVTILSEQILLTVIENNIEKRQGMFITTPNPEIIVEAQRNPVFMEVLSHADISLPDGTGVVMALRMQGTAVKRIRGREFVEHLLQMADAHSWKVCFAGATNENNTSAVKSVKKYYKNILISGIVDIFLLKTGEMTKQNSKSEKQIIEELKNINPQILMLAFGHPKQELWGSRLRGELPETIIMTVGGTLDYMSGTIAPPPAIIAASGMEWVYRLFMQPSRWNRIVTAIIIFPYFYFRNALKSIFYTQQ